MVEAFNQELKYDRLSVISLGGQSEIGQVLWLISYAGQSLLIDAGATYPGEDLPGVDLLLPNTNFLEANQKRIQALLLTNGHEEHSGAVSYILNHINVPRIMAPQFVSTLVSQTLQAKGNDVEVDTVSVRTPYQIGPFEVEWIQVNDAIADACALRIGTPEGNIIYTSSFKLDQTPVDGRKLDLARLAELGDTGVLLLISDSAGVESPGYCASEKSVIKSLTKKISEAKGRVFVVCNGTNTHRLQILFDIAKICNRKVVLMGETLIQTAVVAVITGNLAYDRKSEASLEDLEKLTDEQVLVIATGPDGDALKVTSELAYGTNKEVKLKEGDTFIYSDEVYPGRSRQMALILDQFLSRGVRSVNGVRDGVHVSNHASREELKLLFSVIKPKFFVPALGEGRHIINHARLAEECGVAPNAIFPLANGEVLEIQKGLAMVSGAIESEAVLYNRDQGEKVTSFSVKERRALSAEGVMTIGIVVDNDLNMVSGPEIEAGASGFLKSQEWQDLKEEINQAILQIAQEIGQTQGKDANAMRGQVREHITKLVRQKLQAKPMIQVIIHEVASTSRPQ